VVFLIATIAAPLLVTAIYSFMSRPKSGIGIKWTFSTDAYTQILVQEKLDGTTSLDLRYLEVMWNSFFYSTLTTIATVVLAIPIAMWIATRDAKVRNLLVALVTLPFWTSILIRTYGLRQLIDDNGPVGKIAHFFGWADFHIIYTPIATVIGLTYVFLPFMILPIYANAERFDFRLAEAGYDLGAKRFTVLRKIVLPVIAPGIISGVALVFIPALGSFLQSDMLGGGKTQMIANIIAAQFGQSRNWPFGCALSVFLIVTTLVFVQLTKKVANARGEKVELI
jgi:spermidine/putrescine transport system permease protein